MFNAWTKAYEEKLGYKLDYKIVAVPEQYPQKLALAIAAADLPDIFIANKKNFYLALDGGYCTDLTALKDKYLTDLSKSYVNEYDLPFRAATVDGKLMAFPELNEDPTTDAQLTFMRHDWLENLKLEAPKTAPAKAFMADTDKVPDRWWCVDSVSCDNDPVMLQSTSSAPDSFMVVNSNFKHPEALFDFVNSWFELMFKPGLTEEDYKTYTVSEDYTPQDYAFAGGWWPYVNPRITNLQGVNAGTVDSNTLTGESKVIWDNITAFQNKNYYQAAYDHYWNYSLVDHSSTKIRMNVYDRKGTISNLFYGASTNTMQEKMSTLEKLRDEVIVQIITGEKPITEFDSFISNWYKLGGQDIVNEMNEWYAEQES